MTTVTAALAPRDWRDYAACRDAPADLFFPAPAPGTAAYGRQVAEALAVCRSCRVTAECLGFAITTRQRDGVWGGTTEADRAAARRSLTRGTA